MREDTYLLIEKINIQAVKFIFRGNLDPTKQNLRVLIPEISQTAVNGEIMAVEGYLDIGLIDTMEDLIVNFTGAFIFALLQYIYGKHGDKRIFKSLVPFLQEGGKYKKLEENAE